MRISVDIMSAEYAGLAAQFSVNPDKCDNPGHYEDYLKYNALDDLRNGMGVTHVFLDEDENLIAGYICLRASSLIADMGEKHKFGYPAMEIAELAVDKRYEGTGLGRDMVEYAIDLAQGLNANTMSCQYMLVCADPKAVDFYKHLKFSDIRILQSIPREHWNLNCSPMLMRLTEA